MSVTRKAPASLQPYLDELEAYQLRFAAWLGLDPHEVAKLDETKQPAADLAPTIPQPPDLLVTWRSYDKAVDAEEHLGRYRMPVSMRGTWGEPTVFTNAVMLDWREVERLRAEVGERPEFPAPEGGWPAGWPKP